MTLVVGYLLAITVVEWDPGGGWSIAASMFPLTAPLAMPIRWASGEVPIYQLMLAMALTAAASVLLVSVAASIYRSALLVTGHRAGLREVISGRTLS
jgi:ABC-2 type transport system permease protein